MIEKDTNTYSPHFIILKASAGSGKTHSLTKRFVQFILSEKIPKNNLKNILAITFSNNAAKEMKERILLWLKSVYFNEPELTGELSQIVSLDRKKMIEKAEYLIDEILNNYSDFQVKTIDSFMTTVFKASAIDFGYNPEFDILMSIDSLMEYSFERFLRNVWEGTNEARLFEEIIGKMLEQKRKESAYPWDPSKSLLDEVKKIYRKLASTSKQTKIKDFSSEISASKNRIRTIIEEIEDMIVQSGLDRRGNSAYDSILPLVRGERFADVIGKGLTNPPVNKPKKKLPALQDHYDRIVEIWAEAGELIKEYASYFARSYYKPYMEVYEEFREKIETIKKQHGKIFIEDINRYLAEYLNSKIVPDVYFRLGETIFHFLIDEFQDTSPIQWNNLSPLLENSLSQGGSLFVVGDTKQAIYGFRDADYTIMKDSEDRNPFPSAKHVVKELGKNYRSLQKILDFSEKVFKGIVAESDKYKDAGKASCLVNYTQAVKEDSKNPGYAEVTICDRDDENPAERQTLQELIQELNTRGFRRGDIAVLTQRNEDAVRVTTWLNEKDIDFISYSNLDVRRRKVTGEIVSLLNFLDSPTDNLSFSTFILGDIFSSILEKDSHGIDKEGLRIFLFRYKDNSPLYKSFQKEYGNLWDRYFSGLFKSCGYLPLYDLVAEIYSIFRVFDTLDGEEAALVKILEAVKEFEGAGYNSLRDFLDFASDSEGSESEWDIAVPKDIDAVKVMTIHKSKGLGFPVVIVLLYEDRNRGFEYFTEEDEEGIRLVKITKDISDCSPSLENLYNDEILKDKVNRLNTLYVGFTRAKEELYVIGIKGKKQGYPFDLLPVQDFPPSVKPDKEKVASIESSAAFQIGHHHRQTAFKASSDEIINLEERRRGEFIHRILFFVEYVSEGLQEEIDLIIKKVGSEAGADYPDNEMKKVIMEFLNHEEMAGYFMQKAGRQIMREQEFSDRDGNLFRMDRVIIDSDMITLIDYKTGSDKDAEEKHGAQMKTYMKILRGMYSDREIKGLLAYVDRKEIRRIF